ncbi:MobC family plasmid mobilization relaxosome protein [Streptomyces sp. NPDC058686]|uniref:MobC family plasmid mobilization relaxosome protein n=1 Tax=Streptomyces sp. NPDC058686 TaxID=3346599 RepID=UPI0036468FD8
MPNPHHDDHSANATETQLTPVTAGASNGDGPSTGRSIADTSAPGVAEELLRREGAPEQEGVGHVVVEEQSSSAVARAADEAALYRAAHRRTASSAGRREERMDARYSVDEKARILAKAKSLEITGAHLVGAVVMAFVNGEEHLPDQRTVYDDAIDELASMRAQIARIGNNVNQIAHRLNAGGDPHPVDAAILHRTERLLATAHDAVRAIDDAAFRAAGQKGAA